MFITFDDGTRGLYKYADLALRSVGYHGTSFLISGRVSTSTYYLTWPQIDRMASSGRWSFGGHTHALHTRADFGGTRGPSSVLTNRRRGPDGSREAMAVFTERVRGDVEESLDAFGRHGLPQPAMFAWPFSEARDPSTDRPAAAAAARAIAKAFPMRFVNTAAPDAASRRSIGADAIERLEVVAGMRPDEVLSAMRTMQTVSVDDPADGVWLVNRRKPSAVEIRDRRVGVRPGRAGSTTYTSADWIPQQSADWIDYRVDATLRAPESGRSSLRVRVGSPNEVRVMVGRSSVTVFRHRGVGADRIVDVAVGEFALAPGRDHDVRVEVAEHRTRIVVDEVVVDVPTGRGSVTGGVGADFGRAPGGEWGSLDGLRVRRLDVVNR